MCDVKEVAWIEERLRDFLNCCLAETDNVWVRSALGNVLGRFEMHIIINSKQDSW